MDKDGKTEPSPSLSALLNTEQHYQMITNATVNMLLVDTALDDDKWNKLQKH